MTTLDLLLTRRSEKKLIAPAPNKTQLDLMFQAALHAPDHGKLQPYRFIVMEKDGLLKFETLLKKAVTELGLDENRLHKAEKICRQAPMIIAVVAKINKETNVPAWEQMLCAGCAAYSVQLAANAQGFDNVWVTAPWVDGSELRRAFECDKSDKVIAFLLVGTAEEKLQRECKPVDTTGFIHYL